MTSPKSPQLNLILISTNIPFHIIHTYTMAFNKITSFFLVAVLALAVMSQGADAATIPSWCNCNNDQTKTKKACSTAGGNYDGSSCGLDQIGKYNAFLMSCSSQNGSFKCWH
ncbi:hypothetical protein CPC16_011467 [Podila verticillata]|nr:hypothetical protein CPC16_011467 [Podila verticillata]